MSEIGLDYDGDTSPSRVDARIRLSFAGTKLRGTLERVDDFIVTLRPTGNVSEAIMSGIAYPLAQTMGAILPPLIKQAFYGYSFDVMTVSASSETVEGERITVTPSNISLSNHNDMLMVRGSIQVS